MMSSFRRRHLALAMAGALALPATAATLSGTVSSQGQPLAGAMVTVFDAARLKRDTVYTDAQGRYRIEVAFSGKLAVRARLALYQDAEGELELPTKGSSQRDFQLQRHSVAEDLSASLPASTHLAKLPWASASSREAFISQCNYCHQVGNTLTRSPRSEPAWRDTVRRMEGYFAMLTEKEARDITTLLHKGFDGKPLTRGASDAFDARLAKAKVREWVAGDAMSFIHDTDVGEDDQLYGADEGHDLIWHLDRQSGKISQYKLPDIDLPIGGVFSGVQLPIGVFTGKHGPHSMAQAADGKFWITNALSSTLASFDPVSKKFELVDVGRTHLYPHTIRIDKQGIVWFTIVASNEVGRFDPKTRKLDIITLPHNGLWRAVSHYAFPYVLKVGSWWKDKNFQLGVSHHKWAFQGRSAFPFPYGIDVNPADGSIWYAKLNANKIGRIDPVTLKVKEFDTPMKGPRRLRFDAEGKLWIPAFDDSGLMRFDPRTEGFSTYKLPLLAHNEYEVPYALNVHPKTGDVWITSNMSDRVFVFSPKTERFLVYPLPTRVTWLRDMVFTKDGAVCSSSSNLPAYGIEGGLASFICIYPDGES